MSDRHDAVADHVAHQRLAQTEERLRALNTNDVPTAEEHTQRLREVVRYVRAKATDVDPHLVSPAMLDRVVPQLDQVHARLDQFEADRNPAWLEQAATSCDALLDAVAPLPVPAPDKDLKAAQAAAKELRSHFTDIVSELRSGQKTLDDEAAELSTRLGEVQTSADAQLVAVKTEVEALRTSIQEQSSRLDAALTAFQASSATQVQEVLATAKSAGDTALEEFERSTTAGTKLFTERAEASVTRLEELRDEAAQLVGVVAGTATAGGYMKVADEEHRAANSWRMVAVGSVIAVVGIGIWTLAAIGGAPDVGWGPVAAKLLISGPFGVLAAYAGRQSAGHRNTERHARHVQLQLAALGPYVELLSEEEAAKVRAELASHVFGPPPHPTGSNNDEVITGPALVGLLEKVVNGNSKG